MAVTAITRRQILAGTITDVEVASANKDGTAGTASLRTLGTGAAQAAAGNHTHTASYTLVIGETPGGTVNGSNATFTLANTPVAGSEALHLNGIRLKSGAGNDYTISTLTITMLTVPVTGDVLLADYRY